MKIQEDCEQGLPEEQWLFLQAEARKGILYTCQGTNAAQQRELDALAEAALD